MHEPNETGTPGITDDTSNAPGDKLPPRRRRRAASRPAGPPTGAPGAAAAEETTPAIPAEDSPTAAADAPAEAAPAARPRRRAVRKATAPAGAPQTAETVESAAPAADGDGQDTPTGAVERNEVAEAVEAAPAARPRRRATRKATAPAGAPKPVGEPAEAVAAEEAAPVEAAPEEEETEETEEAAVEPAPAAPRARRRAVRKATAPAGAPQAAEEPVETPAAGTGESLPAAVAEELAAEADEVEEAAPRGRQRRRATAPAGRPEFTAKAEEPVRKGRRAARPAVAVFQAPVFAEPMFQTPETAAAAAAASGSASPYDESDTYEDEKPQERTPRASGGQQPAAEPAAETAAPAQETETAPQGGSRRRRRRRGETVETEPAATPVTLPAEQREETAEAEAETDTDTEHEGDESDEYGDRPSRRRRRGGRRRRRGESGDTEDGEQQEQHDDQAAGSSEDERTSRDEDEDEDHESSASGSSSSRRRRRRRRRSGDASGEEVNTGADDPERTVVKVREPRKKEAEREPGTGFDEVQSIKGSTRMEAKKQRRREGREQGRRRVPIITEAEFLARREAVERVMVVRQSGERTQIGVLEDNVLVEHYVNKEQATSYVGNVYLGKVQNVLPSMEAAFVDIGKGRNAVLYAGEVNFEALGMAHGPRRIESALKSGQSVLVQVTKDPIGHKGARLTSQVSLPGRYLVYVPEGSMTGISRKLPDTERARLKTILKKIVPEDAGVIVRTAAEGASEDELRRDVERLQGQWDEIQKKAKGTTGSNAPTLLYGEPDMTVRVVRDIFNEDFSKVIVSGDDAWDTIHGYVSQVAPDLNDRLSRWTSEVDVFATYRIDEQLMKALDRKVYLPSGGSLVIDKTEAMVVVDVNTGKFTGQGGNLEETVTKNNLEAAEEIVRQLRLRDLGGIVVVDFIDMVLESNRDLVLRRLLECLGRDRTKHQVAEVTSLGLVQMTRKRVGQGLLESFSETCVHCNGRGVIVHMEQPTTTGGGGGGGKRSKKRGRGGAGHEHEHDHEQQAPQHEHADHPGESEAEVAAEVAAPVALPEPEFGADEELYSSPAEAEAAASRGRGRRRATRKATAPAGVPQAAAAPAPQAGQVPAEAEPQRPEPVEEVPRAVPEAVAPEAAEAAEAPEAAPPARTRRRATRKATAPAGSPKQADVPQPVQPVEPTAGPVAAEDPVAPPPPAAEAPAAEPEAPAVEEEPAPAAPPRARRRVTRKVTAPAGSPEGAEAAEVVVVADPSADTPVAGQAADGVSGEPEDTAAEKAEAPVKKTARKTAKKAPAKKAPAAKAPAKKAAAKKTAAKTTAKKTTAKKTTAKKAATKKTVAAEQASPSVTASAPAEDA
ncbi:Rne/Rng family ribonuclease [Streptomyces griseolus]|uniref:Rne/Rng family ribonuclease n=1 Tax=Streptomyces griseolus TaxID=1909 RepID=UPI002243F4DC|nr:Rne/Rng family ribonuclease [Streptomyces griseolus]MCW8215993.1 ribonuclease E/G [Streptomyces griseolus]